MLLLVLLAGRLIATGFGSRHVWRCGTFQVVVFLQRIGLWSPERSVAAFRGGAGRSWSASNKPVLLLKLCLLVLAAIFFGLLLFVTGITVALWSR